MALRRKVILDTCGLLFLVNGDRRLSDGARERLARERHRWYCAISAFEIAQKYSAGKLPLPLPPAQWLAQSIARYRLTEIPLDSSLCIAAAELPLHHRDPADRLIIATARRLQVAVVTTDPQFAAYGVEVIC